MLLIDKFAYFNKLRDVHPVEKMVLSLSLLLFSLAVKDLIVSLITFGVMSVLIIYRAKIPVFYYLKLLIVPGIFLLSSILPILVSISREHAHIQEICWQMYMGNWIIFISRESFLISVNLATSVMSSISCLYFLGLTTPFPAMINVFRKLHVPVILLEIIEYTYRFIFIIFETSILIYQSQTSRLGYITWKNGIRSLGMLVSALFIGTYQRLKNLTMAMHSRGYQGETPYLEEQYPLSLGNWLIILFILTILFVFHFHLGGLLT